MFESTRLNEGGNRGISRAKWLRLKEICTGCSSDTFSIKDKKLLLNCICGIVYKNELEGRSEVLLQSAQGRLHVVKYKKKGIRVFSMRVGLFLRLAS